LKQLRPKVVWLAVALIGIATFAAYHNSFDGPFVFDDASSITTNPTIRKLWPLTEPLSPPKTNVTAQGRPILNLSLAINYAIHGTGVRGFHVFNLIIHALAGLTLFGIVRRTCLNVVRPASPADVPSRATWFAFAVALIWTVHPLQTESVTYIIQRAESLMGLFYLLTLYCFVRGAKCHVLRDTSPRVRWWLTGSVVACAAGMATKEVMATAPLVVLIYDRTFCAESFLAALRARGRYYAALFSTWLLLAWLIAQTGGNRGGSVGFGVDVAWWDYWLTQFPAVFHYLRLAFWPEPLVFEYGSFWVAHLTEVVFPALVLAVLLGVTIAGLWRRSVAGFLGACFFGILAPTSLAPGTTQMIVEHRMYLPLAAVIVAALACTRQVVSGPYRRLAPWLLGAVAITLTAFTIRRNEDYRSEIALWRDTTAKRPHNPLAHFMLAGAWERQGDVSKAIASHETALQLKPDFSVGHEQLGELLLKTGQRAAAVVHFEAALRLQPEFADAHMNLGNAFLAEGRVADAVRHLRAAVRLMPESADARYNLGNALVVAGESDAAVVEYETALRLKPGVAEVHFNLGNVLLERRRIPDAMVHYEAALALRPDYPAARYNLANALAMSGRQAEAVAHYEAALRARPDYAEARHNLASALFELGRLEEAMRHYEDTLRLEPAFPHARENLERVRAKMRMRNPGR
jgi:tetratricopeptide (TPR) repeat protein